MAFLSIGRSNAGVEHKLEKLTETIERNSKTTEMQNKIMIVLTIGIFWLTAAMIYLAVLQITKEFTVRKWTAVGLLCFVSLLTGRISDIKRQVKISNMVANEQERSKRATMIILATIIVLGAIVLAVKHLFF